MLIRIYWVICGKEIIIVNFIINLREINLSLLEILSEGGERESLMVEMVKLRNKNRMLWC